MGLILNVSKSAFLNAVGKVYSCCPEFKTCVPFVCNQGHSISDKYNSLTALLIKFLADVCIPLLEVKLELVSSTSFSSFKARLVNVRYVFVPIFHP